MVGKTAPERGVDLLDAVGDPDRRHGVGFEDLVDPCLATDTATGGRRDLVGSGQQLRRFAGDGRKDILHLVEQQGGLRAALEEHLRDLKGSVTVAPTQRIAIAVSVFHFEKLEIGGHGQATFARRACEDGHEFRLVAVFPHQHRRQLFTHFHEVCQVGDVVFGDQVFDQADTLQP